MKMEDILSIVPLLPAQQYMLSASVREGQKTYVQQLLFEVQNIDGKALETAVDKIVQGYECLRSIILYEGLKQPVWVSLKNMKPRFRFHQMYENELDDFCLALLSKGFVLDKEAAMRLDWIVAASKTYLLFTYHHILFDGWGRQKILSELLFALRYPQAPIQPKLNKNWYEAWKKLNHAVAIDAYKNYLLNFDQIAGLSAHGNGQRENCSLTQFVEEAAIAEAAKVMGLTQAEYLLFAWACFIAKWSNRENVQLGQVKQNGLIDSCRDGFGLGIQTLPFQLKVNFNEKISDLLQRFKMRERALSPCAYADTTNEVFQQLSYDFIIAFENYPIESSLGAYEADFKLLKNYDFSEFPLSLAISPKNGQLILDWHYNQVQHSTAQIEILAKYFTQFLIKICEYSTIKLSEIELWDKPSMPEFSLNIEAEAFFKKIESSLAKQDRSDLYIRLRTYFIEKQIKRIWIVGDKHPNSDVVFVAAWSTGIEVLSLNERESPSFLEKLLLEHPADLIFSREPIQLVPEAIALDNFEQLPENPTLKVREKSIAALSICTSGSTGTPKVVQLSLENLLAFFEAWDAKLPWKSTEVFAAIAHPAFDIGVAELIFPLWKGWESRLIDKNTLSDSQKLQEAMQDVTAFHMVPSLLENWIDHSVADERTRIIMTGGDKVPPHLQTKLQRKFPQARLFQFYGPSECSVLASGFENKGQYETQLLPLGTTFAHCGLMIFDNEDLAAAPYQEGEIIVFGPAVGLGYANADKEAKFFEYRGQKAYRTGDLGFCDAEGNLFFRGRKDNQIKINGQRIELSRIESALAEWSAIEHWVAISDGKQLFAFAKSEKPYNLPEREQLQNWLPFYAIPHFIEFLPDFPLNKNGKVDRQKLLEMAEKLNQQSREKILDENLEAILKELFPNKSIQSKLSWYANGLNSIDALKFSGLLKTKLKINIEINKILVTRCLADLNIAGSKNSDSAEVFIEADQELYSTAARILFLSESDEQFYKSYWINSGIVLPKDTDLAAIKNWIIKQQNLHLAAQAKDNKYIWKKADPAIFELNVENRSAFIQFVENKFLPTDSSLFLSFTGSSAQENYLAFKVNHALLDGLGLERLWKKLEQDLQSGSFSEIKLVAPKEEKIDRDFWANYLKDIEIKALPFERKNSLNIGVERLNFKLSQGERERLEKLCREYHCSLFEAGLILFSQAWKNYYKDGNQAIGLPVNIGTFGAENHIAAMSVNILPFRTDADSPAEILKNWRLLFEKRNTPFSEIAQLDKNQKNGLPFFNATYLYHSQKEQSKFENLDFERANSDYMLSLDFIEEEKELIFSWEYQTNHFSETAIRSIQSDLFGLQQQKHSKIYPAVPTLKQRWETVLMQYSTNTALYFENSSWSYVELNESMAAYAKNYVKKSAGIDVLILERNENAIVKLLFHLINEIPFIPIDSETTEDRIQHICALAKNISPKDAVNQHLQYVIATSGTTGLPKLVGVSKKGYAAAVEAWISDYGMNARDCSMQAASFSFDVSLGDIGRTFFNGASMLLLNATERKDPALMLQKIKTFSVTVFETTPLIARWWLADVVELKNYLDLRLLIVGSDSWKMSELNALYKTKNQKQRIISSYGLSETTIDNSFFDPDTDNHPEYAPDMPVPIGRAMNHCELKVLDNASNPAQDGREGFICIEGPAVGFGYFVDGQWTNFGALSWKSADRGIVDEWGICHFRGRSDRQVKIRGQRVELEEIENILSSISTGNNWHIVDFEQEFSVEMAAFFNAKLSVAEIQQIKKELLAKYPAYYLPTLFIQIDKIPLNINGKSDLAVLRKIALSKFVQKEALQEGTDLLDRLLKHFEHCFNEKAPATEHFFQRGKNSFDAMHFVRSWNRISDEKMAVHQLFGADSFKSLVAQLSFGNQIHEQEKGSERKISKAQEAIWFELKNGHSTLYNLPHLVEIPDTYDLEKLSIAFEKTLKTCPALFVKFYENELGDVFEIALEANDYKLPQKEIEDVEKFREQAFLKALKLLEGPAFEAAILSNGAKNYLYFNPHHLVYDGGSDAAFLNILQNFYEGKPISIDSSNEMPVGSPVDWKNYFSLIQRPEIYFRKADSSLQEALLMPVSIEETGIIHELAAAYQCTPTVILSHLLSKALQASEIGIKWLSLAVDHRTHESVAMQMRAYPFPAYDSENSTDLNIAKQKWALAQLFAAADQQLIYPENIAIQTYHQVGLIIQHPFYLENFVAEQKTVLARPRLPLTLYVEQINNQFLFRWEFDHSQIRMAKINEIHLSFFRLAMELASENNQILHFKPLANNLNAINENTGDISTELKQIWEKYTDSKKLQSQHFFEAGANSIKALLMLKEIEKTLKKRIPAADFFKEPTLKFLKSATQETAAKNLIWKLKEGNSPQELWLLPPIMGFGFIFNSLNLPDNRLSYAFSYPAAMGPDNCKSIEEIARMLLRERLALGDLPEEVLLLGYSMGGLTAFEMAKWLEENGVRVKKLIILDKTAQPEYGKIVQKVNLKGELMDIARQIAADDPDYNRIIDYLKTHESLIEAYQQQGSVSCPIEVFYCEQGFALSDFMKWQRFSSAKLKIQSIANCSHYEIPKIWNKISFDF
jgi:non-ribosomal peptide synthetase component F/NRPS condensation-like uncharacterized protein/surfactin synthase thioesterase subunit